MEEHKCTMDTLTEDFHINIIMSTNGYIVFNKFGKTTGIITDNGDIIPSPIQQPTVSVYNSTTPQKKYLDFHKQLCDDSRELSAKKQQDYCNLDDETDLYTVFGNFMIPEKMGIVTTEQSLMSRIADKFNRLVNVINNDECMVDTENEFDTMMDILNFIVLLSYFRKLKSTEGS
jgi:hypothetical protein